MYWSYLLNSKKNNFLTFESNNDYENLKKDYCELIIDGFFDGFSNDYDMIFISEFSPDKKPLEKEIKFQIQLDDISKAKLILNLD